MIRRNNLTRVDTAGPHHGFIWLLLGFVAFRVTHRRPGQPVVSEAASAGTRHRESTLGPIPRLENMHWMYQQHNIHTRSTCAYMTVSWRLCRTAVLWNVVDMGALILTSRWKNKSTDGNGDCWPKLKVER